MNSVNYKDKYLKYKKKYLDLQNKKMKGGAALVSSSLSVNPELSVDIINKIKSLPVSIQRYLKDIQMYSNTDSKNTNIHTFKIFLIKIDTNIYGAVSTNNGFTKNYSTSYNIMNQIEKKKSIEFYEGIFRSNIQNEFQVLAALTHINDRDLNSDNMDSITQIISECMGYISQGTPIFVKPQQTPQSTSMLSSVSSFFPFGKKNP